MKDKKSGVETQEQKMTEEEFVKGIMEKFSKIVLTLDDSIRTLHGHICDLRKDVDDLRVDVDKLIENQKGGIK